LKNELQNIECRMSNVEMRDDRTRLCDSIFLVRYSSFKSPFGRPIRSDFQFGDERRLNMFPLKTILCPTDFSEPSLLALKAANELARISGAEIIMVHVVSPLPVAPHPEAMASFNVATYMEEMLKSARASMDRLIKEKGPSDVTVRPMVLTGNAADEITRAADEQKVGLIVISTHGLTGWRRFIFGSVAERVVRLSRCPVLAIPAPGEEK
jgi:universal stress protein A